MDLVADILRRRVPHCDVWVFGSRATGKAKRYSDLDLAVAGEDPLPLSAMAALANDFEESLLPFKVDILDLAGVNASFRRIVDSTKIQIQYAEKIDSGAARSRHLRTSRTGRREGNPT